MTKTRPIQEKRRFPRGGLQVVAQYNLEGFLNQGYMTNLSRGGCLFYCTSPAPIQIGTPLELSFDLKNTSHHFVVQGRVVRVTSYYRGTEDYNHELGVEFLNLSEREGKLIEDYVQKFLENVRRAKA
jgi:Tfp pilus assembly protein PilZ